MIADPQVVSNMSLADQLWCPTSVQVTVLQARGLRVKGKSGTNDAYALMQVGKEKFQTSVVEKTVAPVWKEEATFELPPVLQAGGGGPERCMLHVHVQHRALVGPDKQLGQAAINLLQLSEDTTRNKTQWFKLLDKTGKADKDRGEVLLDIQFMKNDMTASMFDLSTAGKSRSRLGKFKDKVRGKKKESEPPVVPSLTQILTDSEEEEEAANGDAEGKGKDKKSKKLKMKSLFAPKSNLQRNMSQSMSVLPAKNSPLSGSQSSGLNVEASEGKKKFKFSMHKRSGSSSNKNVLSGSQKQTPAEQSNLCINGSHVYCEEPLPRTSRIGSNFSLASSGHGSMEDVPESSPPSGDSLEAVKEYSPWMEEGEEDEGEDQHGRDGVDESNEEEEEMIKMEEKRREQEALRRQQEEMERLAEEKLRREEEERIKIQREEERKREEEKKREKELENMRRREEERAAEEERVKREEEERIREEKLKQEEEERQKRDEEQKILEQKMRLEKERELQEEMIRREEEKALEKKRQEEEYKLAEENRLKEESIRREEERAEEERRQQEELMKKLEEEKARREREEYERLEERRMEEEKIRQVEKERIEEEKRTREREERRKKEEEMLRRQELQRLAEEKLRQEEEERRVKAEKAEREAEEELRREEEERIKKEQIKRDEEKRREEEEERARKEKEENERAEEMRRKEEEKRRKEEEERIKKEQIKRDEEKMREEEEERARKEKEENERAEEMRRKEEEKRRKEEEERIKMERAERERIEESRKLEKEIKIDQEQRAAEKTSQKPKPAEIASNQFEDFSPPEPHGLTDKDETVLRCQPEVSSARSGAVSADETDLIKTQWEKRLAPQPPGRNPSETQIQNEDDTRHLSGVNKQSKEKDIKTVSVPPQRSMQMITPLNRSPEDVENVPSEPQNNHAKATKHGKRPAPSRPPPGGDEPPSKPRRDVSQTKRVGTPQSLNPFEDDELTDDATTHGPPAGSQTANKDDASQAKIKSSKVARAPAPPALSEARYDKGDAQPRVKGHVQAQESSYKETEQNKMVAGVKEEEPPVKSRRRLTVKPLNPLEQQQPTSLVQEENCRSTGSVHTGDQCNSKVEAVITGPYSQLTQEELISMVLKQEKQLSEREKKISELERYIDNLLVRVIEEQPSILMSLSALK
ncbi:caldesmon [Nothobranchius furzeri]